jgi:lipoate-protein ligase A
MAIDEALLRNVKPDWPVVLRIYRWDRPTLSVGHFQRIEDRSQHPSLGELPWVRRKTGGGAIVHDQELTYSVLIPNRVGRPAKGHSESLYRDIHLSFAETLISLGWDAGLSESCTCPTSEQRNTKPFLCFLRRSPVDLVIGNDKILGSAQRRSAAGLLQHGSCLLRRSQWTPELCGLLDAEKKPISKKEVREKRSVDASTFTDHFDNQLSSNEVGNWIDLFGSMIKAGLSRSVRVNWQSGSLQDLMIVGS